MKQLELLDNQIRQGQSREVQATLRELVKARHSTPHTREENLGLAALCRRSGWAEGGLILLNPIVRPSARSQAQSTGGERCEYGACLVQIGAGSEALPLFESAEVAPRFLFEAFYRFSIWDYSSALLSLRRYLSEFELAPYERFIGEVNLVAALVSTKNFAEATPLLVRLKEEAARREMRLLLGNLFEIEAQTYLEREQWKLADQSLNESYRLLQGHSNWEMLYVLKWRLILDIRQKGFNAPQKKSANELIAQAKVLRHSETWRDLEFQLAKITGNRKLAERVYLGTPFSAFREKIVSELKYTPKAEEYLWCTGKSPTHTLDILTGLVSPRTCPLKSGQVVQRLLAALAADFYRSPTLAALHAQVFPGRYYNPLSSPAVMHQALKRLRQWLEQKKIPLEVLEQQGTYSLSGERTAIRVYRDAITNHSGSSQVLRQSFPKAPFQRRDFENLRGISARAANYHLKALQLAGIISVEGHGPARTYRLKAR